MGNKSSLYKGYLVFTIGPLGNSFIYKMRQIIFNGEGLSIYFDGIKESKGEVIEILGKGVACIDDGLLNVKLTLIPPGKKLKKNPNWKLKFIKSNKGEKTYIESICGLSQICKQNLEKIKSKK